MAFSLASLRSSAAHSSQYSYGLYRVGCVVVLARIMVLGTLKKEK